MFVTNQLVKYILFHKSINYKRNIYSSNNVSIEYFLHKNLDNIIIYLL